MGGPCSGCVYQWPYGPIYPPNDETRLQIRVVKPDRLTNPALGWLTGVGFLSGLIANAFGTDWGIVVVHGIVGLAILFFVPWKSTIVRRGLRHRRSSSSTSILLGVFALLTVATGIGHSTGLVKHLGPLATMQVHIGAAVVTTVFLVVHIRSRPVPPANLDRRAVLRLLGVGAGAAGLWSGTDLASGGRRFTGSHRIAAPIPTQWLDDRPPTTDKESAELLVVAGDETTRVSFGSFPQEVVRATLDCTSGWYADAEFRGVRLDRVIGKQTNSTLVVRSGTGYTRKFPMTDVEHLWLVTEMNGAPLSRGHGFPLRLVAPGRRGFWWVKWVRSIELVDSPWWWQSPYPLQ